ncbi:MAG: hypothetical protein ACHQ9S_01720 [Candidatus Binatia bacterium]
MPAITLGLAEVEERLRALRRRLNFVTAQHSAYLAMSLVLLVAALLIILGLRASASVFRIAAWGSTLVLIGAGAACVVYARRHWLDVRATAHLVDERGQLTDRLATLVDLRLRPRPSRLAPVLVAQALALGARWQAQRIAPRRIPRSAVLVIASLLALGATTLVERHTARPASPAATSARNKLVASNGPVSVRPSSAGGTTTTDQMARQGGGQLRTDLPPGADSGSGPRSAMDQDSPPAAGVGSIEPKDGSASLTDRLQHAIHQAFRTETPDIKDQLASRSGASGDEGRAHEDHDAQRHSGAEMSGNASDTDHEKNRDRPQSGSGAAQREGGSDAPQNFEGSSPGAGEGSNPQGLMEPNAGNLATGDGESKRFKLTITSFLHSVEQQDTQLRRKGTGTGSAGPTESGSGGMALNDRQLTDDALRKTEIPPEYEDLVRRVFSLRAGR